MAELVPHPFGALARRMFLELDRNDAIFDLPRRKFYPGSAADLSVRFHGRRASSPLGPAAGPQTQMAQNLVLSWLAGGRILELKTVQTNDELDIPRPCIDMQTIGYNAEWSQELKLHESLDEYVKGAMLIEMLRASGRIDLDDGFHDTLYDMSVGYDLAGIQSERVLAFVRGMLDARPTIERLRREIPPELRPLGDLDFPARLSGSITLSTFHGCPPDEIERILDFLMRELGVDCVVKFNPMLLGASETRGLLHDTLGYTDIRVPDRAFERDATWQQAVEIVERLERTAASLGLGFGVKFSNTLIVENHRGFLPTDLDEVYLSGPPLHVLAMSLVRRFRRHFGGRIPISFSAGIDRANFADAVAIGLTPITVCSDLLKTGGYGRLPGYQRQLVSRMADVGAAGTGDFILRAYDLAAAALDQVSGVDAERRRACLGAIDDGDDLRSAAGDALYDDWVDATTLLNTEHYVERALTDPRYTRARNTKAPRKIGRRLQLFDCVTCDICVPVCPNDANFTFGDADARVPIVVARRSNGVWHRHVDGETVLAERHQIGTFADFCNECGNCDVFCPEDGGPYTLKPRFFGSEVEWRRHASLDGFHLSRLSDHDLALGRFRGSEFRLEAHGHDVRVTGPGFALAYDVRETDGPATGHGPDEIDLTPIEIMSYLLRALLDTPRINVVNVADTGRTPERG